MYRHTATSYMMRHSLPSPEHTGDSDSDSEIMQELEQKRRDLDEQIAKFKANKDKEFKDFENDLRLRRKQKRTLHQAPSSGCDNPHKTSPPAINVSSSNNLATVPTSRFNLTSNRKQKEPMRLMTPDIRMQATSPTLCLERMNITAQNPSVANDSISLLSTNSLGRISSQSSSESIPHTPPQNKSPVTSKQEHHDAALNGLFVPSYLPLLDAKLKSDFQSTDDPIAEAQTEPTSPNHSLLAESTTLHSSSLPSSLPSETQNSSQFVVPTNARAYTVPNVPTRSLAPIIRNVNGRKASIRKRKRVTFQLADRAIVEPSSSYEEAPSPSLESDKGSDTSSSKSDILAPGSNRKRRSRDQFGRSISSENLETKKEDVGMGMGDLLMASEYGDPSGEFFEQKQPDSKSHNADSYFSNDHPYRQPLNLEEESPEKFNPFEKVDDDRYLLKYRDKLRLGRKNSKSPPRLPRNVAAHPGMETPIDINATGNVGFFELDEELASPGAKEPKPFQAEEHEDSANVKASTELEDHAAEAAVAARSGQRMPVAFAVGSVPIDIVRSNSNSWQDGMTNSWIGTFGH